MLTFPSLLNLNAHANSSQYEASTAAITSQTYNLASGSFSKSLLTQAEKYKGKQMRNIITLYIQLEGSHLG